MRNELSGRLLVLFLALCSAVVVLPGCGGGGGSAVAPPDAQLFTPNYISSLTTLVHWGHLPMTVSFHLPSDVNQYGWNPNIYANAANEWNQPGKQVMTQVVPNGTPADVVVDFVSRSDFGGGTNSTGITNMNYNTSNYRIVSASIKVTPQSPFGGWLSSNDAQVTIAHELGHALGINGHSSNPLDLMYTTFTPGQPSEPTTSDFNTIMTAYAAYFGRGVLSVQEAPTRSEGPLGTSTIE